MRNAFVYIVILIIALFSSCAKCDYISVNDAALGLTIVDSVTAKYIYSTSTPLRSKDSLRVTDERGERMETWFYETNTGSGERFEVLGIRILTNDNASGQACLSREVTKRMNIYLGARDSVKLDISFRGKEVKCGTTIRSMSMVQNGKQIPSEGDLITRATIRVKL